MPRKRIRLCRVLGTVTAVCALAVGCGTPDDAGSPRNTTPQSTTSTPPPSPTPNVPAKVYTVEEIAAAVGCTPEFQGKLLDYRRASCNTPTEDFILFDFQTADGQRAWLDTALVYGGVYLVGDRWLLTSRTRETMEQLSTTLGGVIEESPMNSSGR
jgi:hypothetical protein